MYMLPLTHDDTRPCGSTMSLQMSKKWSSTIEQQYLHVLSERAQGHLVEGLIMQCMSVSLCLNFPVSPLTCTNDGTRLDLETEKMMYLGNHSNDVSVMSFAREKSMHISLPWSSPWFTQDSLTAHWPLDVLITSSWDLSLTFWDPCTAAGTSNANADTAISTHVLPKRIYHLDLVNNTLVVGMASCLFHIYNIRKMGEPVQTREAYDVESGLYGRWKRWFHFPFKFTLSHTSGATDADAHGPQAMWLVLSKAGLMWNTLTQVQRSEIRNMRSSATDRLLMM